jgi:AcrR family transcriptional regulator
MAPTSVERGREVRQRLLSAAAELVGERGWTAVSTRLVADRAGVAPGLVHYHFGSVSALLAEAAVSAMRSVLDDLGTWLRAASTADEVLDLLLGSLEPYTGRDPASLLFVETYLAATRDEALRQRIYDVLAEFRQRLAECLRAHRVAEPERTAAVLAATIDGVLLHRALDPELSAATVAPVLRSLLGTVGARRTRSKKRPSSGERR